MLSHKTVLILGAGASAPFGFPTGGALFKQIQKYSHDISLLKRTIHFEAGLRETTPFKTIADLIARGPFNSIDALLGQYTELINAGKYLIALHLMPHEKPEKTLGVDRDADWMRYLFNQMEGTTIDEFAKNPLTVITFNYDRSFEYYFHHHLQLRYRVDPATANKAMNNIPVIHVHGSLGRLVDIPYIGNESNGQFFARAAGSIKIIHEADDTSPEFVQAQEALRLADRIGMLGFGFHTKNMDRLDFNRTIKSKPIFATCRGMYPPELTDFGKRVKVASGKNLEIHDLDCLELLRQSSLLY